MLMHVKTNLQPLPVEDVWSSRFRNGIQKEKDLCRFVKSHKQVQNVCYKLSRWWILYPKNNRRGQYVPERC